MSRIQDDIKITNFSYTEEKMKTRNTVVRTKKFKLREKFNIHFYSIEKISELELVIYFNYKVNYGNLIYITFNGKCNLISLNGNVDIITMVLKAEKNTDIYKNNIFLIETINRIMSGNCIKNVKRICEKHNINFINVNLSDDEKKKFKDITFLDGNEKLI